MGRIIVHINKSLHENKFCIVIFYEHGLGAIAIFKSKAPSRYVLSHASTGNGTGSWRICRLYCPMRRCAQAMQLTNYCKGGTRMIAVSLAQCAGFLATCHKDATTHNLLMKKAVHFSGCQIVEFQNGDGGHFRCGFNTSNKTTLFETHFQNGNYRSAS